MNKKHASIAVLLVSILSICTFTARSQMRVTITPWESSQKTRKAVLKKVFNPKPYQKTAGVEWSHAPYNTRRCGLCHQTNSRKTPGAMKGPVNEICLHCHTYMQIGPHSHEPVQKDCGYCHNAHNSDNPMFLHKPIQVLCITCHQDTGRKMRYNVSHGALLDDASCENCHRSHWSTYKKLINLSQAELCTRCHGGEGKIVRDNQRRVLDNIANRLKKSVQHKPFAEGDCAACHDFHGSPYPRLLKYPFPSDFYTPYNPRKYALCFSCHQQKRITEAQTTSDTGFRDGDLNLHYVHTVKPAEGRSCRACHDSHATNDPFLIRSSVPFGTTKWQLNITFTATKTGGRCSKTCHDETTYNNGGRRPTDVGRPYLNRIKNNPSE